MAVEDKQHQPQAPQKTYRGWYDANRNPHVTVNGRPLRCIGYHSDEFGWGYGGSGPAELALAILANHFGERPTRTSRRLFNGEYRCWTHHQAFKRDVVAGFDETWELTGNQIAAWFERQPEREPPDPHGRNVISFQELF